MVLGDDRDGTRRCEELVPGDVLDEARLARPRAGDEDAFRELTDPYRRELQVHCYRILGSVQDAAGSLAQLRAGCCPRRGRRSRAARQHRRGDDPLAAGDAAPCERRARSTATPWRC
jgi:hypothetical protein